MKTAGEILSLLFDEGFAKKAQGYSKLFNSWEDITAKNGIASAAGYSRIKDLDRGVLLVEMDHPGWKQILQTKQSKLLNDFRIRFPDLDISAISLVLSTPSRSAEDKTQKEITPKIEEPHVNIPVAQKEPTQDPALEPASGGYDAIKDDDFREKLIRLGQSIADRESAF